MDNHPRRRDYFEALARTDWRNWRPPDRTVPNMFRKAVSRALPTSVKNAGRAFMQARHQWPPVWKSGGGRAHSSRSSGRKHNEMWHTRMLMRHEATTESLLWQIAFWRAAKSDLSFDNPRQVHLSLWIAIARGELLRRG